MTKHEAARPTHIVAKPGDKRSLCGLKDPLPRVAAEFVQRHVDGYGMAVCRECATVANRDIYTLIEERLAEVYKPDGARVWMAARHHRFGGLTVDEMLDTGRGTEVLDVIEQLASGACS